MNEQNNGVLQQTEAEGFEENLLSPAYYLYVLRKRYKLVLSFFLAGVVASVMVLTRTEPLYEAKAQVLFSVGPPSRRGEIVDKDYAGVGISTIFEQDSYINTQMELLKGRGLARAVIERLHLENCDEFKPRKKPLLGALVSRIRRFISSKIWTTEEPKPQKLNAVDKSALVSAFVSRVGVKRTGQGRNTSGSRIVEVTFTGRDTETIKKILNTMLEVFKEQDVERRYKAAKEVLDWLQAKQRDVLLAIEEAENRVQNYIESENLAITPSLTEDAGRTDTEKLDSLSEAVVKANAKRIQAETLYRTLQELVKKDAPLPTEGENEVIQDLQKKYAELETKRAALSERFGEKWPEIRDITQQMAAIKDQIQRERQKIVDAARASYELARRQEEELRRELEKQKAQAIELRRKGVIYRTLRREARANEQIFDMLLSSAKEASIAQSIDRSQVSVVTPAYIAGEKAIARARKIAFGLIFLSLFGGFALAVLLERINPRIQSEQEAEDSFGIPLFGSIGKIDKETLRGNGRAFPVLIRDNPKSVYAQQFQRITANAVAHIIGNGGKSILVTSINPKEGKSLVASNLAACLAKAGKKVLLIDADMHQPRQHDIFELKNRAGFAALLKDESPVAETAVETNVPNLHLIVAGEKEARNEVLPLRLDRLSFVLEELKKQFDVTIMDSPPVGVVADALGLSQVTDAVLLVIRSGAITKLMGRYVIRQLEGVKANVIGAVLNGVAPRKGGYGYYYYYYYPYRYYGYYGDQPGTKVKKKRKRR